jgi:hypothetical protein
MVAAVESSRARSKYRACGINVAMDFFRAGLERFMTKQ